MYTYYRTLTIVPGKTQAAMAWAHELTAYLKEQHGLDIRMALPVAGNPMRLGWVTSHPDLSTIEAGLAKMAGDARYWEIVNQGADCILPGSVSDEIWRNL